MLTPTCQALRSLPRAVVLSALLPILPAAHAATYVVVNTSPSGAGSLHQALLNANANPGRDTISFNIPGGGVKTIVPTASLPQVTDPVVIDGTTQPGYSGMPLIEVAGQSAGGVNGLLITAGNSLVRGLAINRFALSGLRLEGYGSNLVQRVFLGTDSTGTNALPNGVYGLAIVNSPGNQIGGLTPSVANVIGSNAYAGVFINGSAATDNHVEGNFIGTDPTGRLTLGNGADGIQIFGAPGNWVGGTNAGSGNVVSGNKQSGIYVNGATSTENWILRNYVGTGIDGTNALPNQEDGITLVGASGNYVGAPGAGNLVSGNLFGGIAVGGATTTTNAIQGNFVGTDFTGRRAIANVRSGITLVGVKGVLVGGANPGEGNLASGNGESGIRLADATTSANRILGNKIGTDVAGTNALPNALHGISIYGPSNVVGGVSQSAANVISGNLLNGVYLFGSTATRNLLMGNLIGLATDGTNRLANGSYGIRIEGAPANRVGGCVAGTANAVSGNLVSGILLAGVGASNNLVVGNLLGTDLSGRLARGNGADGVGISNAPGNYVGGAGPGEGNLISANTGAGVWISGAAASNNVIAGNFIGSDLLGRAALGNAKQGLYISAPRTVIGGSQPGAGNLVAANNNVAVSIGDASSVDTVVQGNWIGLQADGVSPLGNTWHGIEVLSAASRTVVGGAAPGAGNRIANTRTALYAGVRVRDGCTNNAIRGNVIFTNAGLGIDLGANGVNTNRIGAGPGPSANANLYQNYPVLTSATNRFRTVIQGTLNSVSNQTFALDFFANNPADATGYGEGMVWLGSAAVTTSPAGTASFTVVFTNTVALAGSVCATATDSAGNTSEFSANVPIATGTIADTDGDGMPNDYELAWGFNPSSPADANLDADGDGLTNLQEYKSGTDPRDASDYLRIGTSFGRGQTFWASVDSRPGKSYSLLRSTQLPPSWQTILTGVPGLDGTIWLVDTNRPSGPTAFYRLRCDP